MTNPQDQDARNALAFPTPVPLRDVDAQPQFRNDDPRWTDWGYPQRPAPFVHMLNTDTRSILDPTTCCQLLVTELPARSLFTADAPLTVTCPGREAFIPKVCDGCTHALHQAHECTVLLPNDVGNLVLCPCEVAQ